MFRSSLFVAGYLLVLGCAKGDSGDSGLAEPVAVEPASKGVRWRPSTLMSGGEIAEEFLGAVNEVGIYYRLTTDGDSFMLDCFGHVVRGTIAFKGKQVTLKPTQLDGVAVAKVKKPDSVREPGAARYHKLLTNPIVGVCKEDKSALAITLDFDDVLFTSEASLKATVAQKDKWIVGEWEGTTSGNSLPNVNFVFWSDNEFVSDHPDVFGGKWRVSGNAIELSAIKTANGAKPGAKGPRISVGAGNALSVSYDGGATVKLVRKKWK